MEPPTTGQRINIAESVRTTSNQDGAVLLDIKQGLCFSMNPIAARIWEILEAGSSVDRIVSALELEFHVPRTQIEPDVTEFLDHLQRQNLIRVGSESKGERKSWLERVLS